MSTSSPPARSPSASASAFARTCAWYSRNASEAAILKHVAFAAIACSAGRPAAREDGAVDRRGVLLAAEDEPRARAGQGLVRRRADDVAIRDRVRVQAGGDEAREVGHVAPQESADLVGDLAELPRLDLRGYAEPPQRITFGRCSFASASTSS